MVILVHGYEHKKVEVIFSFYQFLGIATMRFYIAFNITFF